MKIIDVSSRDFAGAVVQWLGYLKADLGFDHDVAASVNVGAENVTIAWHGADQFQKLTQWEDHIGEQEYCNAVFPHDAEWEDVCVQVWDRLKAAMRKDERELRHGIKLMGRMLEKGTYESAIGKMIADRIRSVRDDASAHLIEFQKSKQVP